MTSAIEFGRLRRDDVDTRHHHFTNRLVRHLEDAVDHFALLLLDDPLLLADVEEQFQLFLSDERPAHAVAPSCGANDEL